MKRVSIFIFLLNHFFQQIDSESSDGAICDNDNFCQRRNHLKVIEILKVAQKEYFTGQALVASSWLLKFEESGVEDDISGGVPVLVYDPSKPSSNHSRNSTIQIIRSSKFTSSHFTHLQHHHTSTMFQCIDLFTKSQPNESSFWSWRLYSSFKLGLLTDGSRSRLISLMQKDLFVVTFSKLETSLSSSRDVYSHNSYNNLDYKYNTILVGCLKLEHLSSNNCSPNQSICAFSNSKGMRLVQKVTSCRRSGFHIDALQNMMTPNHRRRFHFQNSSQHLEESQDISRLTRKPVDPLSRKGFLYSSLVFIAKKTPDNATNNVWGPFTVASWIGILAAYTVTAIVFGVIKIVTMNNLDNSWYDCIVNQLLSFVSDEKIIHHQEQDSGGGGGGGGGLQRVVTISPTISSSTVGITFVDENENHFKNQNHLAPPPGENYIGETRRISVRSLTVPVPEQFPPSRRSSHNIALQESSSQVSRHLQRRQRENRGEISKAILYGTIRVVSFLLLALYEGKLYNTITFPKSKLVASFDDLISNEKYFIKLSSEAAKYENITDRIKVMRENFTTIPGVRGLVQPNQSNRSNKVVESVNILDCVNWVESGPDPNHACVGYEFELRNLHKAQKSDKILVKSKQRLLRFGSASSKLGSIRRRGFTLFPGGFQISKWILESGILQLWSILENAFMESLINPNWSDPFKVFTIRDYLGLFVVYSLLLILASIMFLLEHVISLGKRILRGSKLGEWWKRVETRVKDLGNSLNDTIRRIVVQPCAQCGLKIKVEMCRSKKYFRGINSVRHSSNV